MFVERILFLHVKIVSSRLYVDENTDIEDLLKKHNGCIVLWRKEKNIYHVLMAKAILWMMKNISKVYIWQMLTSINMMI